MAEIELRLNPSRDILAIKALRLGRQNSNGLLTDPVTGFSSRNRRDVFNRAAAATPCLTAPIIRRRLRKGWTLRDALHTGACDSTATGGGSIFTGELSAGLINYWPLNEASGTRFDSVRSINLSEFGGAVPSAAGKRGLAANGNNGVAYLQTPDAIDMAPPITFSMWMKILSVPASAIYPLSCESLYIAYDSSANITFNGGVTYITLPLGALSTWHMIVLTIDASLVWRASIDGAAFTQAAGGTPAGISFVGILGTSFNGLMDEVGLWNRALSQSEVDSLWNGGAGRFY